MKKIVLVLLVLSIAMTSIFASCAGNSQSGTSTAPGEATPTPTPTRTKDTIAVWWSTNDNDKTLLDEAWWDFKDVYSKKEGSKYYDVKDKLQLFSMPGNADSVTDLELLIMAQSAPDLVRMDHVYVSALGQKGNVLDLQKEFQATDNLKDKFIESCWMASSYKKTGAVFGIPFDANTIIFGGKKNLLDQAGVALPTNYDELLSTGNILKQQGFDVDVYTLPCGTDERLNWPVFVFLFYVWRLGGDVLSEDYSQVIFNDPETGVAALNMMLELQKQGLISATNYDEGKTILCDYGTWTLNGFTEPMVFDLLPTLKEGVERWSGLGLYDFSVVKTSTNPELAYDFAVHFATGKNSLTDEYYQYTFAKRNNLIPSLKDAAGSSDFTDPVQQQFWEKSVVQLALSKYRPCVPEWPFIEEELSKAINSAMKGEKDPTEALETAARAINGRLG